MKTIKVFLAYSDELKDDRIRFGNLIRKLNEIYEKRGIQIKLFEWEDYDASYNGVSKQSEYNEQICDSDIFLALFHIKAGKYTIEEFNCATEEFKKHASPKIYTYIKTLAPGEAESPDLKSFKENLLKDLGHYWCNYNNTDTMHLHFVMQLQLIESQPLVKVKIQNNDLLLDNTPVVNLENVPLVSLNKEFQHIKEEIDEIDDDLADLRERLAHDHDNIQLRSRLLKKSNKREELKKEMERNQQFLFDTAMKFTRLQGEKCSERIYKAKELLDEGKAAEANAILNMEDMDQDAMSNVKGYRATKAQEYAWEENIINSINEFNLKASTIMVDDSIPNMSDRCNEACKAYVKAIELAKIIHYNKIVPILYSYACLLQDFNRMAESIPVFEQTIGFLRYDVNQDVTFYPILATVLKDFADVHAQLYHFEEAENAYQESIAIRRKMAESGDETDLYNLYKTIGSIAFYHFRAHKYEEADKEYDEALEILNALMEQYGNKYFADIAETMGNASLLHTDLHQYKKAEYELKESLDIFKKIENVDEEYRLSNIATSLENLALMYEDTRNLDEAEKTLKEALSIERKLYAKNEEVYLPHLVVPMQNLANIHSYEGKYEEAEKEMQEVLRIHILLSDKNGGALMPEIAGNYDNLGVLYNDMKRYDESEEMFNKALEIYDSISKNDGSKFLPEKAGTLDNLSILYKDQGRFDEAENSLIQVISIYKQLAQESQEAYTTWIARAIGNLSSLYVASRKAEKAEIKAKEALQIDDSQTWIYTNLMTSYIMQSKFDEADKMLLVLKQLDTYFTKEYIKELEDYEEKNYFSDEQKAFVEDKKKELLKLLD
jgi:tetratricopeptide (TPR) repeat protein